MPLPDIWPTNSFAIAWESESFPGHREWEATKRWPQNRLGFVVGEMPPNFPTPKHASFFGLVSMKCHCTATVNGETWQVYLDVAKLYTKVIHILWEPNFVLALHLSLLQCKEGNPLPNWSHFVVKSQTSITVCYSCMSQSLGSKTFNSACIHVYILHFTLVTSNRWELYTCMYTPFTSVTHRKAICRHFTLCKLATHAQLLLAWKVNFTTASFKIENPVHSK